MSDNVKECIKEFLDEGFYSAEVFKRMIENDLNKSITDEEFNKIMEEIDV